MHGRPAELYVLPNEDRAVIYADPETADLLLDLAECAPRLVKQLRQVREVTGAKTLTGALRIIRRWKPKARKRR